TAEISECRHRAKYLQSLFGDDQYPLEKLNGLKVAALSAIAVPESFETALESFGATLVYRRRFADHHRFSQQEIIDTLNEAEAAGAEALLTTEKDAVRFPYMERRNLPLLYMRVEIEMLSGEEAFMKWISRICFKQAQRAS
ncbi:MAG TPA: tetraacyldisaccharide 4'-kinase, partial [Verrucomicrobia bacterium]|nr:tetraacyldisaccharide 4'-kinase [Verrucomicrobiota bacterium]